MIGVYAIVCLPTRKLYVGQSTNIGKRFRDHKYRLRRQIHINKPLQKAWNKWGEGMFSFFIIEETTKRSLFKRESYWITTLRVFNPSIGFNKDKFKNAKSNNQDAGQT